jgi:hypothetical protein
MEAARPDYAPTPDEFERAGFAWAMVEADQLCAFKDGIEDWWLVVPGPLGDEETEYHFL